MSKVLRVLTFTDDRGRSVADQEGNSEKYSLEHNEEISEFRLEGWKANAWHVGTFYSVALVFKRTFLLAEQFGHFWAEQFGSVFGRTSIFYELFYEHFQKDAKVDITGFFKSLHKK